MSIELIKIEKELHPIAEQATTLEIVDDITLKTGVELLSKLNQYNDSMQEEKEKVTKPLNEALRAERLRFKPLESVYTLAIEAIRAKMTQYQSNLVRERLEAQNKLASKVTSGYMKPETAVSKLENLAVVEKEVATSNGLVQFAEVKKFEVVDMTLLPLKYHLPDEVAIRKEMKEGREIVGVKYWIEQQPRNYR